MQVTLFNGVSIDQQLKSFLPQFTDYHSPKMYQYALDMLFAGTHDKKRVITVVENGERKTFEPVSYANRNELLYYKVINENTGYVKINNSLGNNNLIGEFDKALDSLISNKNLILDLTETPSGGNSTVARAIMGRFVNKVLPYQIHEFDEKDYDTKRHWVEYVSPRKKTYKGNLYILVGHWTGSMGEGIAIGFDALDRATVIGTPMAGLLGAISNFRLTETKIGFQFPTERLYHINGIPREDFIPKILCKNVEETLEKAKEVAF
jgi:carboxyl-terminal processing protease